MNSSVEAATTAGDIVSDTVRPIGDNEEDDETFREDVGSVALTTTTNGSDRAPGAAAGGSSSSSSSSFYAGAFFREQDDMVSEILSFLDLRSMLTMSTTSKKAASLLRYEHVFTSADRKRTATTTTTTAEKNSRIILNKLSKVYHLDGDSGSAPPPTSAPAPASAAAAPKKTPTPTPTPPTPGRFPPGTSPLLLQQRWKTHTRPTPLRLLRLVNGRKCERCLRDLRSPCIWAGRSGLGTVVLPSLSFGAFCCTRCIFADNKNKNQNQNNKNNIKNDKTASSLSPPSTLPSTSSSRAMPRRRSPVTSSTGTTTTTTAIPSTMRHPLLVRNTL